MEDKTFSLPTWVTSKPVMAVVVFVLLLFFLSDTKEDKKLPQTTSTTETKADTGVSGLTTIVV